LTNSTGEVTNIHEVHSSIAKLTATSVSWNQQVDSMSGFDQMSIKKGQVVDRKPGVPYKLQAEELVGLYGSPSHGGP